MKIRVARIACLDMVLGANAYLLASVTHPSRPWPPSPISIMVELCVPVMVLTFILTALGTYTKAWSELRIDDLKALCLRVGFFLILIWTFLYSLGVSPPLSFIATFIIVYFTGMFASRILAVYQFRSGIEVSKRGQSSRVLIFGAGEAAEKFLRTMARNHSLKTVKGIIDDDPSKREKPVFGVSVLGGFPESIGIIRSLNIDEIIICIEKIPAAKINWLIDQVDLRNVRMRIIPAEREVLDENKKTTHPRRLYAEDILSRQPVRFDHELIKDAFKDKVVMITGAGGSIGSEICHQLLSYPLRELVCLSRSEFSLYNLEEKLEGENKKGISIRYCLGNVCDKDAMDHLFKERRPHVLFHAAAHKHVPYMEVHEREAVKNNVIGTECILTTSREYGVKKFILISTDKAVNPRNVMGATKRLAELITEDAHDEEGLHTAIVRFGNVLGSKGSVVPLFRRQILRGGPVTVTHPEVVRYFMTIPEAALLVINCGALAEGGEKFILDMGKPIRIDDLVRKMLRLYGYQPGVDIDIQYTGLRPGEKLVEELLNKKERVRKTINDKIFVSIEESPPPAHYRRQMKELNDNVGRMSGEEVRKAIQKIIPEFGYTQTS